MQRNIITSIESKTKVNKFFSLWDLNFVIGYILVAYILKNKVNDLLVIPYMIFNICCSIFFILPSAYNKKRNNLKSIFILLKQDKLVYRPYYLDDIKQENSNE